MSAFEEGRREALRVFEVAAIAGIPLDMIHAVMRGARDYAHAVEMVRGMIAQRAAMADHDPGAAPRIDEHQPVEWAN